MRKIALTGKGIGQYTLVDDEDFNWLMQWKWRLTSWGYVCRTTKKNKKIKI